MSMSMELLIAAVAVGIALLMAVGAPIAMEPIGPAVELITMLDCISMMSALRITKTDLSLDWMDWAGDF